MTDTKCCEECNQPVYNNLTNKVMYDKCAKSACSCHTKAPTVSERMESQMGNALRKLGDVPLKPLEAPTIPEWESQLIPEYSKLAVFNEDSADGYEMVPAIPFIRSTLQEATREARVKELEWVLGCIQRADGYADMTISTVADRLKTLTHK